MRVNFVLEGLGHVTTVAAIACIIRLADGMAQLHHGAEVDWWEPLAFGAKASIAHVSARLLEWICVSNVVFQVMLLRLLSELDKLPDLAITTESESDSDFHDNDDDPSLSGASGERRRMGTPLLHLPQQQEKPGCTAVVDSETRNKLPSQISTENRWHMMLVRLLGEGLHRANGWTTRSWCALQPS